MRVAVLGATGAVGRTMLHALERSRLPVSEIVPLASERSAGAHVDWRGRAWSVAVPAAGVFDGCELALFSAGAERSREWAPRAVAEGATVIDNSSAWRLDPDVPLVVPEVNGLRARTAQRGVIANPNCVTIQLVLALEALRRAAGLIRVTVATYQSVSGAGQAGLDALAAELRGSVPATTPFAGPIGGNVIPLVGALDCQGWAAEESKIRAETRKILELPDLPVAATCVRVPVEVGHSVALTVETERPIGPGDAVDALRSMESVRYYDSIEELLPRAIAGQDDVRTGRLRPDPDLPNVFHLWIVADNLRKGAALNAVQIAEQLSGD